MKNGKFKRIMSFAMSALIALGVFVPGTEISASAAIVDSGACGENLTWTLDSEGVLEISGEGEMDDLEFYSCTDITRLIISNGVTSIGERAFDRCSNITSVTIPDSVTTIGSDAFLNCKSLLNIEISDSVTVIGNRAFGNCTALKRITVNSNNNYYTNDDSGVLYSKDKTKLIQYPAGNDREFFTIPDNVTSIGMGAFCGSSHLTSVTISENVTSIGSYTFFQCKELKNIIIPCGVKEIGRSAFAGCTGLTSINIPNGIKTIGDSAFDNCVNLTNINIPESVTSIGDFAFDGCTNLTDITIDYGINEICDNAFYGCTGLTSIVIPESVTSISAQAFYECTNLKNITIPSSVISIGYQAFYNCDALTELIIPNGVKIIGGSTFYGCSGITRINIPDSVTSIGDYAFLDCTGLADIIIPDSVTSIGEGVFGECTALEKIIVDSKNEYYSNDDSGILFNKNKTKLIQFPAGSSKTTYAIPEGVTSISPYAFFGCTGLKSVTLPGSITKIGKRAFYYCKSLTNIIIPGNVTNIESNAFLQCSNLTSVIISPNVTKIDFRVFYECTGLTSINIPDKVKSIGDSAFYGCTGLTSIDIPDGVTSIGSNAFYGCTGLTSIDIPDSVTNIGNSAFFNIPNICYDTGKMMAAGSPWGAKHINLYCENNILYDSSEKRELIYCSKKLKGEITIPYGVLNIRDNAFQNCMDLTSIIIPDSVTNIGNYAFSNCKYLANPYIPDSVESIGKYAFQDVYNICYDAEKMEAAGSPWGAKYVNKYYEDNIVYDTPEKKVILYCAKNAKGELTIPGSVTEIKANAFADCLNLTNINIPSSVEEIGLNAFKNVMNITFDPEKMTAEGAPWGAKSTTAYTEGDFVYYDNSKAMLIGCLDSESETITVPDCVEAVDCYAFTLCDNLQALSFSSSQIVFSPETLVGCPSVQIVSSANTSDGITFTNYNPDAFSAKGGEVHYAGDNGILFADRTMSGTYSVPDSVSFICPSAFAACSELEIAIPDSVTLTSIGKDAFFNSKNYIDWKKNGIFQIGSYLIEAEKNINSFEIPEYIICIADGAFDGCLELLSVSSLGRRLLSVGKYCFRGCSKLNTVTIPDSVRYFGDSAFEDTPITKSASSKVVTVGNTLISVPLSTKQYEVPGSISCIADGAFKGCELMTSVRLTGNIENLGEECFAGCLALKEITIPENVTAIGKNTFKDCVSLAEINIPEKVKKIDYTSFYGCTGITGFTVDEDNAWFAAENGLLMNKDKTELLQYPASKQGEEYIIPLKVKYIESLAFRKCLNLSRVSIPKGIKYGYKNPFENCDLENRLYNEDGFDDYNNTVYYIGGGKRELVSVTQKINGTYVIEKGVNIIRDGAFKDQTGITEIIFNDKLNVIGEEAFMGCTGLTEINIPAGVVRIEKSAFEDCVNLKKVTFGTYNSYENEALESVGEYAFANTGMTATKNIFGPDESRYNKLFVETDAFHQHTPGEPEIAVIADSTCTEEGLRHIITRCTDEKCGKVFDAKEAIPKKEHTPKEPVIENATTSSCLIEGKYDVVVYCDECGNEISRETVIVKAEGHKYIDNVTAPTCDKQGFTTHTCICGDSYVDNYTDALGHSFSHYVFNNDAKINRDGTETAKCDRCDEEDTRIAVGTAKKEAVTAIRNMEKYNDKTISYKSTITFYAKAENCTDVQWYINGQRVNANADGSCTAAKAQNNIEVFFTAKDEDGNTVKSETERITVKQGFFDKLIAFFRDLFGLLPVITQ